jgi:ribosomal protein S18 acetylase RimI-like enzyme
MDSDALLIRNARAGDLAAARDVAALAFESVRSIYRPSEEAYVRRPARGRRYKRLVALIDGRLVGTVQYTVEDGRLHIVGLATHPDYRRRGVARGLIGHLEALGKRLHLRALSLSTIGETGNPALFERMGFATCLEEPAADVISPRGDALTEVYMEKVLG